MKKIVAMLVTVMVTLFTVNALAFTPPPSPAPMSWISDSSHVLSDAAHARLDAKLREINQSSANEIAALIVQSLDGEDIATVGDLTAKAWGVGKKDLDNGVLVVLAMKDRKSRISTGKGVEGDLPDLKANDILQAARPYLRKGDVEGALGFIFDRTSKTITNHKAEVAAGKSSGSSGGPSCDVSGAVGLAAGSEPILIVIVLGAIALVWYLSAQAKRRRQLEEAERQAAQQRLQARRRQIEEREAARKRDEEKQRKANLLLKTPVVDVPVVPRPAPSKPTVPRPTKKAKKVATPAPVSNAAIAAAAAAAAAEELARSQKAAADRRRREQEEETRRARERAEEDRRRRERDEEDRRRRDSSSSSSSFDWGSSSGSSGSFGGGDFGGGGGSSDW